MTVVLERVWWGLVKFEDCEESFLRHFYRTDLLHAFLALLLFLEQLALSGNIAAVTLGRHVLTNGLDSLTRNDFCPDGSLDGYVELLARNKFLEFLAHAAPERKGIVGMGECGKCVDAFTVEKYVKLDKLRLAETVNMVVERGVPFRYALEFVVEINYDFAEGHIEGQFHAVIPAPNLLRHLLHHLFQIVLFVPVYTMLL